MASEPIQRPGKEPAVKIIKKGTPPKDVIWKGECNTCHTVAEANESELKVQHCQRDGSWGLAKCPVCEAPNMIFYPQK